MKSSLALARSLLLVALGAIVASCTAPISANPIQDVTTAIKTAQPQPNLGTVVEQGLLDATYNLDQAVAVGALQKTDPAPPCFHGFLTQLGIDPANPPAPSSSFVPKVSDLISAGSVLYIRAQQLKGLQGGGITVPASCKELIAQFLLDAAAAQTNALPGGGILPKLR